MKLLSSALALALGIALSSQARAGDLIVSRALETPAGPLPLRVYLGQDCRGMLYVDDGVSFDFKQGKFLRIESTCSVEHNTLHVRVGPHQGDFRAWWSQVLIEVYGWAASSTHAKLAGEEVKGSWNSTINAWQTTIPDSGNGLDLTLEP